MQMPYQSPAPETLIGCRLESVVHNDG